MRVSFILPFFAIQQIYKYYDNKKNNLSQNSLNLTSLDWLTNLSEILVVGGYAKGTIQSYVAQMRLLFHYYHDKEVEDICAEDITQYLLFIKKVHGVGRAKCRAVAHSCSFFFKKVLVKPFVLPTVLYPRKEYKLPNIMTVEEVKQLFNSVTDHRVRSVLGLCYGCGMRLGEVRNLCISDIDSVQYQILIRQGKGNKDRFTLLPEALLTDMRNHFRAYRPKVHLFESKQTGRAMHERSIQLLITIGMEKAGVNPDYAAGFYYRCEMLRHSVFARFSSSK